MSAGQGGAGFKAPAMYIIAGEGGPQGSGDARIAGMPTEGMPAEVSNDVEAVEESGEDMFARAGLAAE